jgi:hypothetical protein
MNTLIFSDFIYICIRNDIIKMRTYRIKMHLLQSFKVTFL